MDNLNILRTTLPPMHQRPTRKYKVVNGKRVPVRPTPSPDQVASMMNGLNIYGRHVSPVRRPPSRSPSASPAKKKPKRRPSNSSSSEFGKKKKTIIGLTPDEYTIATSTIPNAGNGAFANILLPKGTVLGSYKGKKLSAAQYNRLKDQSYVWELSSRYGPIYVDGKNPKLSNWLRFLNDSRDRRINVEPFQYRGNIYYRTNKTIKPGTEMFISYGDEYWD